MINCPVCKSSYVNPPLECSECGTPLRRANLANRKWTEWVSVLLPGAGHLWRGSLIVGSIFIFFTSFLLVTLVSKFEIIATRPQLVLTWGFSWILLSALAHWSIENNPRRFPDPGEIISMIFVELVVANFLATITLGLLFYRNFVMK